ncbi:MAG: cytochrome c biogenesis protein ResB [Candidatus Omnitrophota bacterium]
MDSKDKTRFWGMFSSVKLAIVLLALIIFFSVLGTFIPQGLERAEYIHRYGRYTYNLFSALGFTDLFHAWWFILLLSLLGLNLLVCSLNRIRFRKSSAGLVVTHLSILIILTGAIIGAFLGERGFMPLYEGQASDSFVTNKGIGKLDFKIHLDDFILEWYNKPGHQITAVVQDRKIKKVFLAEMGKKYPIEGTGLALQILRYLPDFYLKDKNSGTRSDAPNNPAVLVRIYKDQASEDRWVFEKFPGFFEDKDKDVELLYKWQGQIKDFKSKLKVIDGESVVRTATIEVNHPLKFNGYTFYQSRYDLEQLNWTGLEVVKDPGVPFVYAGFILLNVGIILVFYPKIRTGRPRK